jgi:2OG-Fe(II) oxygenase superfamily
MIRSYAVIDDFLPRQHHLDLWDAFQKMMLVPESAPEWSRSYRLLDGESPQRLQDEAIGAAPPPLRLFTEKLLALMTGREPLIAVDPWTGFTQSAWVYRRNEGLEWHSDTGWLAGYIYYAHPTWHASWGGELLIGADGAGADACRSGGVFVYPAPNRLVLLRGGTMHCIKKVEPAASKAFRASVSGFFFNTG